MSSPRTPEEIDAEIADHLATAAERLQSQGASPADAQVQAAEKFGDTAAIRRSCYWIQQGDSLMFRGAVIALLSLLCLGLTLTAIASWQSQARMAQQMTALTEQLKALAERPSPAPVAEAKAEVKPLEIHGRAFVAAPDHPAANKSLTIISVGDGKVARRITTSADGEFQSGPLPAGDYAVVATLDDFNNAEVQTAPILVYPGAPPAPIALDVSYPTGRIKVETSRPLPQVTKEGEYTIESRLLIKVTSKRWRELRWTTASSAPAVWPVFVRPRNDSLQVDPSRSGTRWFYELLSNAEMNESQSKTRFYDDAGAIAAGECEVSALLLTDVIPAGYEPPQLELTPFASPRGWREFGFGHNDRLNRDHGPASLSSGRLSLSDDNFFWLTKGLGRLWYESLLQDEGQTIRPMEEPQLLPLGMDGITTTPVSIKRGQMTRIRIEIPADLETKVASLVATFATADEFKQFLMGTVPLESEGPGKKLLRGEWPFLQFANVTAVGSEPLAAKSTAEDSGL